MKTKTKTEVIKMEKANNSIETEIAVIKKDIEVIRDNHLTHIEKDMNMIHRKVDKIDARLWWFAGIIIAATVGPLIAGMIT